MISRLVTSRTPGRHLLGKGLAQTEHVRAESTATRGTVFVAEWNGRYACANATSFAVWFGSRVGQLAKGQ